MNLPDGVVEAVVSDLIDRFGPGETLRSLAARLIAYATSVGNDKLTVQIFGVGDVQIRVRNSEGD